MGKQYTYLNKLTIYWFDGSLDLVVDSYFLFEGMLEHAKLNSCNRLIGPEELMGRFASSFHLAQYHDINLIGAIT